MSRPETCRATPLRTVAGAASALCLMWACSDGVSRPLALSDAYADAGSDAELAFEPDADDPRQTDGAASPAPTCASLARTWPHDAEAQKFVEQLNKLRADPSSVCGPGSPASPAFSVRTELECVSRMRLKTEMPPRTGTSPQLIIPDPFEGPDAISLDQRGRKAGISRERLMFELIVSNAPTAQAVLDAFPNNLIRLCPAVFVPFFRSVGVARVDHAWAITFAAQEKPASRPGLGGR